MFVGSTIVFFFPFWHRDYSVVKLESKGQLKYILTLKLKTMRCVFTLEFLYFSIHFIHNLIVTCLHAQCYFHLSLLQAE